jgi:hypothetical protein
MFERFAYPLSNDYLLVKKIWQACVILDLDRENTHEFRHSGLDPESSENR